jgi:hypothetical protein
MLSNICLTYLGTSQVHALRHTFAVGMMRSGAPITELAGRLGHTDIKITSIYWLFSNVRATRGKIAILLEQVRRHPPLSLHHSPHTKAFCRSECAKVRRDWGISRRGDQKKKLCRLFPICIDDVFIKRVFTLKPCQFHDVRHRHGFALIQLFGSFQFLRINRIFRFWSASGSPSCTCRV